ncbi:unnamed protein product [Amaranthus hypochondriacus]
MYSKANSEAEYVDPETLWERLNDAVDTIIRRDETTETGQFLQPCIEAALVLGCHPVRAPRSQRNSNPRSYLNQRFQEPAQAAPAVPDSTNYHRPPPQPPNLSGSPLSISRSTMGTQPSASSLSSSQMVSKPSYIATQTGPYSQLNFPRHMPSSVTESNSLLKYGSVYPLYYGSQIQNVEPHFGYRTPQNSNPTNVIVGTPVRWHGAQPPFSSTKNLLPGENVNSTAGNLGQVTSVDSHGKAAETDCDLSLRLGPPSNRGTSVEKGFRHLNTESGSSSHQETNKYSEHCVRNTEFCFFPSHSRNEPSEFSDNRLEQEGWILDSNVNFKKRKASDHSES